MALQTIDTINIPSFALQTKGFGLLYNSYAFIHANFAPANWKVPTETELQTLMAYIKSAVDFKSQRNFPTFVTGWLTGGANTYNFSLLPGGLRRADASFYGANSAGTIASKTTGSGYYRTLFCTDANYLNIAGYAANFGLSVRLLMIDSSGWTAGDTLTDVDGNVYDTVKVGNQVWIASNWKCTKLNDGTPIALNSGNTYDWRYTTTPQYCSYNCVGIKEE